MNNFSATSDSIKSLRMVFNIKLNHNKRQMDSRVSSPAINYITFGDDEMEEPSTNETPKMPKKKHPNTANRSEPAMNNSDEESEDEMASQIGANGIDSTFGIHSESSNDADDWSSDDDAELIQKIKTSCRVGDKASYKTRMRTLDWETIAFKKYSGTECQQRFKLHLKNVRRHRNLSEIVNDVESNIKKCPIKKPLNAYQLFIQDQLTKQTTQGDFAETMRNLSTRFNQLAVEQRAIYESKALQLRSEYNELKGAYKSGNFKEVSEKKRTPASSKLKTPFMLYLDDAKLENEDVDTSKLREKYANLSLDEKYKYVVKAVGLAPDANQTTLLNKEEQRIFKGHVKTAPTAYSLFVKETIPKLKEKCEAKNVFAECSKKWKTLSAKQKKMYTDAAEILKARIKKEQDEFNERHGVAPAKIKRRKSTFVERNTETEEASPLSKKRKLSVSLTQGSESGTEDTRKQTPIKSEQIERKTPTPKKQSSIPMTVIHTPLSSMQKKTHKLNSETSDSSLVQMETVSQMDSDAIDSTTPSSLKKKSKKEKKNKKEKKSKRMPPPDPESKPPADLFTYFARSVHTGKPHKARKAFDRLTKAEKKRISGEYNEKVDQFVTHLREYLATLPNDEAVAYIEEVKAAEDAEKAAEKGTRINNNQ